LPAISAEPTSQSARVTGPDQPPAPETLLPAIREGDETAAAALIERLYPFILKIVRSYRTRRTGEEDLCQMIFARLFQRLHQYSGAAPLEHWVSRLAVNTCLNQIEKERIRPELRYADLSEGQAQIVEQLARTSAEIPDEYRAEAREIVHQLLEQLAPKDRLIITLLHLEERSIAEIKALTGWNATLIKVRAFRARQKLKHLYTQLAEPIR
jgi:RNA polymerase sigma-70 factor (ECF subfamily)